jgi:hypothetical protein
MKQTTHEQWRGMVIWAGRSNGPPCRCHPGNFMDLITLDERRAGEVWLSLHLVVCPTEET